MATENTTTSGGGERGTAWTVFRWMLREEWRLHSSLFGGRRFAAFPVFVLLLSTGSVAALTAVGTDFGRVIAGFHALVFAFGLHTGSIGLVGRDAQRNVLPTGTLIVFSARTLPLSLRRLIGLFLLKDAVYYAALFLLPLTVGVAPAVATGDLALVAIPVLWGSATATFVLGVTVTFAGVALSTRGAPGGLVAAVLAAVAGLLWVASDLLAYTPYGLYAGTPGLAALGTGLTLAALLAVGFLAYDPTYESPARSARGFRAWRTRLGGDALLVKSVLDVRRSSGGLFKLVFSGGVLFAVSKARPYWNSGLFPIIFVISAVLSGTALVMAVYVLRRKFFDGQPVDLDLLDRLGQLLIAFVLTDAAFTAIESLIALTSLEHVEVGTWLLIATGEMSWSFWLVMVGLGWVLPAVLTSRRAWRRTPWLMVVAGLSVVVGIVGVRFNIVVPPLIMPVMEGLPAGDYLPTLVEWGTSVGIIGLGLAIYTLGAELLPLTPLDTDGDSA